MAIKIVTIDGKVVGQCGLWGKRKIGFFGKRKAVWGFCPNDDISLLQPIRPQTNLKRLGEEIKLAIGMTGEVQFAKPPSLIKTAPKWQRKKRPRGMRPKPTPEEWRDLERKEARLWPRNASIECRNDNVSSGAKPVEGGLPGLGKRR